MVDLGDLALTDRLRGDRGKLIHLTGYKHRNVPRLACYPSRGLAMAGAKMLCGFLFSRPAHIKSLRFAIRLNRLSFAWDLEALIAETGLTARVGLA